MLIKKIPDHIRYYENYNCMIKVSVNDPNSDLVAFQLLNLEEFSNMTFHRTKGISMRGIMREHFIVEKISAISIDYSIFNNVGLRGDYV